MFITKRNDCALLGDAKHAKWGFLLKFIPYLVLGIASLLPFMSFLKTGPYLPNGDDQLWHRIWSFDLALGFQDGFFGTNGPSHHLMGNLGLGTYLFYAPLSHYFVAILHSVFPFVSINVALKILAIVSTFMGGAWTYQFTKKICKDDLVALMLGLCFIFMPYRINCYLYRGAYPEATAIAFYPLLFLGLQGIVMKEFTPRNFTYCVLGVSCLILTHPFTALIGILIGAIYLLISYRWIIPFFKDRNAMIYGAVSCVLVFFLIGWYFFPMLQYKNSGLYSVSDPILMWTNADHLAGDVIRSDIFSGFLRPHWIDELIYKYGFANPGNETWMRWVFDYLSFGFFGLLGLALMEFLIRKHYALQGTLLGAGVSLFSLLFASREEVFLVVPLYALCLLLIGFSSEEKKDKNEMLGILKEEVRSPEIYWAIAAFGFCFLLMYTKRIWYLVPSILLTAQFPWRIWGICLFLAIVLLAYFVKPFSGRRLASGGVAIAATFLFLSCMGPVDKRFATQNGNGLHPEPSIEIIEGTKRMGCQNEYVPLVFQLDSEHVSSYQKSLYRAVFYQVNYRGYDYNFGIKEYMKPAFLEGEGDFEITSLKSPEATFDVSVLSENAFVQLPQFYYDGYVLELKNLATGRFESVKGEEVDGLVSFHLKAGEYQACLRWKGTTSYQIFSPLLPVGIAGLVALNAIPWAIAKFEERKKADAEETK